MSLLRLRLAKAKLRRLALLLTTCASILVLLILIAPDLPANTASPPEYALKAVFLFNFAQFVDWPGDAFSEPEAPFVIGVLGDDPFGTYLDETVHDERVNDRPMAVVRFQHPDEIKNCHVLFISRSEANNVDTIVTGLRDRSILTVADSEGAPNKDVMIRFVTLKNKIKLQINVEAAKSARLTISSKLLRLAEIVSPGKE